MKWTVKLVAEVVDGKQIEHEIATVERADGISPATVGLTIAEGKGILESLQKEIVTAQVQHHGASIPSCPRCGRAYRTKVIIRLLFDPFTVKWACAFVGSEDVPARGRSRVASQRCSQTRTRSRPGCGISPPRWLRKMVRRAFCSAAMAPHRASSYAIADQLSCGTTQERRTLVLRAPDGPHRAMDCRRIRQRVGSRRVATRRVGGFRAVERSSRIRSGDRHRICSRLRRPTQF